MDHGLKEVSVGVCTLLYLHQTLFVFRERDSKGEGDGVVRWGAGVDGGRCRGRGGGGGVGWVGGIADSGSAIADP